MAITYTGKQYGGYSRDEEGNASTQIILMFLYTAGESPVDISQQPQIPSNGAKYSTGSNLILKGVSIARVDGDLKKGSYHATLDYRFTKQTDFEDQTLKPWKRNPTAISIAPLEQVVAFVKAYQDGDSFGSPSKSVLNPAGDPYEDSTLEQNTIIRFTYNLQTFQTGWLDKYIDMVNDSNISVVDISIPTAKGRIKNLSASYQIEYDTDGDIAYKYWSIDTEIELGKKYWRKEILARGLYFLSGGMKYRIYTDNKGSFGNKTDMGANATAVDEPQKLNADGSLYVGTGGVYDIYYDKFYGSWASLNFPKKRFN